MPRPTCSCSEDPECSLLVTGAGLADGRAVGGGTWAPGISSPWRGQRPSILRHGEVWRECLAMASEFPAHSILGKELCSRLSVCQGIFVEWVRGPVSHTEDGAGTPVQPGYSWRGSRMPPHPQHRRPCRFGVRNGKWVEEKHASVPVLRSLQGALCSGNPAFAGSAGRYSGCGTFSLRSVPGEFRAQVVEVCGLNVRCIDRRAPGGWAAVTASSNFSWGCSVGSVPSTGTD